MFLSWDNSFSVNVESFNNAHKELIDLINNIHHNMESGKNPDVVRSVLERLSEYTLKHFTEEEKLMIEHQFPYYEDHKEEHMKFIREVDNLREKLNTNSNLINIQVLYFLKDWLTNHILNTDKKYSSFFNQRGIY